MKQKQIKAEDLNRIIRETYRDLEYLQKSIKDLRSKIELLKDEYNINSEVNKITRDKELNLKAEYSIEDVREAANDWLKARGETELVTSTSRLQHISVVRQIAWLILKNYGYSVQAIADAFNRNHSSVTIGSQKATTLLSIKDKYYVHVYDSIIQILETYYAKNSEYTRYPGENLPKLKGAKLA